MHAGADVRQGPWGAAGFRSGLQMAEPCGCARAEAPARLFPAASQCRGVENVFGADFGRAAARLALGTRAAVTVPFVTGTLAAPSTPPQADSSFARRERCIGTAELALHQ